MINNNGSNFFRVRKLDVYMNGHNGFIAGGCFKNIFNNQESKDIDIFFESEKDFNEARKYFKLQKGFIQFYKNKKAVGILDKKNNVKIDLIRSKFGKPEEVIGLFDFTITKFAYFKKESDDGITYECVYHDNFFEDLINKKLVIDDKMPFPVGTFERSYRYTRYGYGLCRESKEKLIIALQGASPNSLSQDLYTGFD